MKYTTGWGTQSIKYGGRPQFWKVEKIAMSQQRFDQSLWSLAWWQTVLSEHNLPFKIRTLKIQDGRQLLSWKPLNSHISARIRPFFAKFGKITHFHCFYPIDCK